MIEFQMVAEKCNKLIFVQAIGAKPQFECSLAWTFCEIQLSPPLHSGRVQFNFPEKKVIPIALRVFSVRLIFEPF